MPAKKQSEHEIKINAIIKNICKIILLIWSQLKEDSIAGIFFCQNQFWGSEILVLSARTSGIVHCVKYHNSIEF